MERGDALLHQLRHRDRAFAGRHRRPGERPVLDVRPPRAYDVALALRHVERGHHPVGAAVAHRVHHLADTRVGDAVAVHEREVEVATPLDLLDHQPGHHRDLLLAREVLVGRGGAQDPPPGGGDAGEVEVGLGREVVEQQARARCRPRPRCRRARGPGSASPRSWRARCPPAGGAGRRRSAAGVRGGCGHAIEHCSTVCEGQGHGLLPLPARRRPPRPRARLRRPPRSSRSRPRRTAASRGCARAAATTGRPTR